MRKMRLRQGSAPGPPGWNLGKEKNVEEKRRKGRGGDRGKGRKWNGEVGVT